MSKHEMEIDQFEKMYGQPGSKKEVGKTSLDEIAKEFSGAQVVNTIEEIAAIFQENHDQPEIIMSKQYIYI